MPTNVTGDATGGSFPANVVAPSDGDLAVAVSAQTPFEDLADRTHWLRRNPSFAAQNWVEHIGITSGTAGPFTPEGIASGPFSTATQKPVLVVVGDWVSGTTTTAAYTSNSSTNQWVSCNADGTGGTEDLSCAVWEPVTGNWLLMGPSGHTLRSSEIDGPWTDETTGGPGATRCCATDGLGLVATASTAFSQSADGGVTWSAATSWPVTGASFAAMAYGGGVWVAVGDYVSGVSRVVRSVDADTWAGSTTPPATTADMVDVTWTGTHFICVSDTGGIFRSTDGDVWTEIFTSATLGTVLSGRSIAADSAGSGVVVACVINITAGPLMYYAVSQNHGELWSWVAQAPYSVTADKLHFATGGYWAAASSSGTNFSVAKSLSVGV